ncbi:MAG: hypothetical protein JOZ69_04260, partial [Myxococcales bacterium]|nr:hypothetical protein [Myxococcales bacterium]
DDVAGGLLVDWKNDELTELPPMEVTLPAQGRHEGDVVPVRLRSQVTEVGTLLLEAEPLQPIREGERWRVELSVRGDLPEGTLGGEMDAGAAGDEFADTGSGVPGLGQGGGEGG